LHDRIIIGCESHAYAHWLENYAEIGAVNGYSPQDIESYGAFIKLFYRLNRSFITT